MYPYYIFITDNLTGINYRCSVESYRQGISEDSFRRVLSRTPFKLQKEMGSLLPYKVSLRHRYDFQWQEDEAVLMSTHSNYNPKRYAEVGSLYDFYEFIGYDKKTKKFNGISYRKFLLGRIEEGKV